MRYGIAISTYFSPNTDRNRLYIFLASVHSLLSSGFDGKIVIVDDGSPASEHLHALYDVTDRIQYVKRPQNIGVGRCKNTCLKTLAGCEYVFLADDDLIYNGANETRALACKWWELYIQASKKADIHHFCYYEPQIYHTPPAEIVQYRGVSLVRYRELNGCLLFLTSKAVTEIGGFRDANVKSALEHSNYSQRCVAGKLAPFAADVMGSREFIRLNRSSYDCQAVPASERSGYVPGCSTSGSLFEPIRE
jgi:glycosyltransferase involved in cell wall biosynthesis